MDDIIDFFRFMALPLGGIITVVFLLCFLSYEYEVNVGQSNIVEAYNGDKKIYEGKAAFISVESGGMTTTVLIHKSLFPFRILDKAYSSNLITIKPKGE